MSADGEKRQKQAIRVRSAKMERAYPVLSGVVRDSTSEEAALQFLKQAISYSETPELHRFAVELARTALRGLQTPMHRLLAEQIVAGV